MMNEDEQAVVNCALCRVPILTWWASGEGGLLRGEYVLVADWVYHPRCWDKILEWKQTEEDEANWKPTEEKER